MTSKGYENGDYLVQCDRSGFICKRSECRLTWDNKLVRADFWEPRHPQDIILPKNDDQSVPDSRIRSDDPPIFDGNVYYDMYVSYEDMMSYEVKSVFDASFVI